jgi:hypothetical protein
MSWRAGGLLFAEIWPAIEKHIPDREMRIAFTTELLRAFVRRDPDPWSVEDVHPDVRVAIRRAGMSISEPERYSDDE